MSNHLAVATVTAVLRQLIHDAVEDLIPGTLVEVTTVRPDHVVSSNGGQPTTGVNIFLYQISPNAAYRNADLPTRAGDGTLANRPVAALDLHYLISFHGVDGQLEPQRLLGRTVGALHARAVLTRARVETFVTAVQAATHTDTERNLRRVFDAADAGCAVLLFDESDALFGRRTEVKDAHDRFANIEVSYLLTRMEAYRGLAILTTNARAALDPAFLRRIRYVVQFPFPEPHERAEIWRRAFPWDTPTEGLDIERLARLPVAGGNIRNMALNAAFLAADEGTPVRMEHLLRAARTEYAKLEKPLADADVRGWS